MRQAKEDLKKLLDWKEWLDYASAIFLVICAKTSLLEWLSEAQKFAIKFLKVLAWTGTAVGISFSGIIGIGVLMISAIAIGVTLVANKLWTIKVYVCIPFIVACAIVYAIYVLSKSNSKKSGASNLK